MAPGSVSQPSGPSSASAVTITATHAPPPVVGVSKCPCAMTTAVPDPRGERLRSVRLRVNGRAATVGGSESWAAAQCCKQHILASKGIKYVKQRIDERRSCLLAVLLLYTGNSPTSFCGPMRRTAYLSRGLELKPFYNSRSRALLSALALVTRSRTRTSFSFAMYHCILPRIPNLRAGAAIPRTFGLLTSAVPGSIRHASVTMWMGVL